jgi:hypothetical protein
MYIHDYSDLGGILPEPPVPDLPWVPKRLKPFVYPARWLASALLWPVASAHREGNRLAAGWAFANGYADMLTRLTSALPPSARFAPDPAWLNRLNKIKWQDVIKRETKRYIELGRDGAADAIGKLLEAGNALVAQSFLDFIREHGTDAWKQLKVEHRRLYGERDGDRLQRYERILHNQVREKQDIGIPLQAPGGRAR